MSNFKVAVAQVPSINGNVDANIDVHLRAIEKASELAVSYIVFPELSLTGYDPEHALQFAFTLNDSRLQPLIDSAINNNINIAVGAPLCADGLVNIGLIIISPKGIINSYAKMNLHSGEELYFSKGDHYHCLSINGCKIANAICADANQPKHVEHYAEVGAEVYIMSVLITENGYQSDTRLMASYAKKFNMLVAMANHTQPTGDWAPIGKSAVWSENGLLASANETQSALLVAEKRERGWIAEVIEILDV